VSGPASAYSERFLDHLTRPRAQGALPSATHSGTAEDDACGDRLSLDLLVRDGVVVDARFRVLGCPGAIAVGSALASLLPGRPARGDAVPAAALEAECGGVPAAKRHALRLAAEALRVALASPR
jgi:nitrogen fixation NifU-like protein